MTDKKEDAVRKTTEFLRYDFTVKETEEMSKDMAQKVSELNQAESDKKAVMSDLKGRIDTLQASVNDSAHKITTGFEMRRMDCEMRPDYKKKIWNVHRTDNGKKVRTRPMSEDDLQKKLASGDGRWDIKGVTCQDAHT